MAFADELERRIAAAPPTATTKGMFFQTVASALERRASKPAADELRARFPKRYVSFMDYSVADWMKMAGAACQLGWRAREYDGMREIGWAIYDDFVSSLVGRVVFGVLGRDLRRILNMAPRGYGLCNSYGARSVADEGERIVVGFRGEYIFPQFHWGVIEGVSRYCDANARVSLQVLDDQAFDVSCRP